MLNKPSLKLILLHLAAWTLFILLMTLTAMFHNPAYRFNLVITLFTYSQAAFIFYGSNYLFFKLLPTRRYQALAIAEILFALLVFLLLTFCAYVLEPVLYGQKVTMPTLSNLKWYIVSTILWLHLLLVVLSLGYYFARRTVIHQKERRQAEVKQQQAEQAKLETEYAFLRAQINPHFLYNTLNFLYAKSLGGAPELSEGILVLNDIMRYSLESGEDKNGLVSLEHETTHVQNVIRLHQLRFTNRLKVNFEIQGNLNAIRTVPLVLITLVENAFKHGELMDELHPVSFTLSVHPGQQRRLTFISLNKKRKGPLEAYSGIGLVNIRKRLTAAYGNNYQLEITDEADFFTVNLNIDQL